MGAVSKKNVAVTSEPVLHVQIKCFFNRLFGIFRTVHRCVRGTGSLVTFVREASRYTIEKICGREPIRPVLPKDSRRLRYCIPGIRKLQDIQLRDFLALRVREGSALRVTTAFLSFGTALSQTLCTESSRLGVLKVARLHHCIVTMERTKWPSYGLMLLRFAATRYWLLGFWVVVLGCCCCPPQAGAFVRIVPTKPTKISGGGVHVRPRTSTLLPSKMSLQTPPKKETGKTGVPGKDEKTNDQPGIATSLQPKATSTADDGTRSAIVSEQDRNSEALKQRLLIGAKPPEEQDVMWKLKVRLPNLSCFLYC